MQRFVLFTLLFIWVAGFVMFMLRKHGRANDAIIEDFIETERNANSARRKDIDESLFFTPDLAVLPKGAAENKAYRRVTATAARKMLRFEHPITNVELKLAYGPSQLEDIALMEENFQEYVRALVYWAEDLYEAGITEDTLRIINYTLEIGSDFKRSFTLAADIYAADNRGEELNKLIELAGSRTFPDESVKRSVIKYIMDARAVL